MPSPRAPEIANVVAAAKIRALRGSPCGIPSLVCRGGPQNGFHNYRLGEHQASQGWRPIGLGRLPFPKFRKHFENQAGWGDDPDVLSGVPWCGAAVRPPCGVPIPNWCSAIWVCRAGRASRNKKWLSTLAQVVPIRMGRVTLLAWPALRDDVCERAVVWQTGPAGWWRWAR